MKVVCVHSSDVFLETEFGSFTVGKQYDCEFIVHNPHLSVQECYVIKNDNGLSRSFSKTRFELCFIPLSEVRQEKLEKLGV